MICKHCRHTITMAGGVCFHIDGGFANICKICGCQSPELGDEKNDKSALWK